ncbi:MAG: hypothetical protein ACREXT_06965 [Gammaproteobacteria bacterium]
MYTITATFNRVNEAHRALNALRDAGFAVSDENTVKPVPKSVGAPTDGVEVSPERATSPGAEESGSTAVKGVAIGSAVGFVLGLGAAPFVGPAGPLAGAGVGAYAGSLVGALQGLEASPGEATKNRLALGETLTVMTESDSGRAKAFDILSSSGAVRVVETS